MVDVPKISIPCTHDIKPCTHDILCYPRHGRCTQDMWMYPRHGQYTQDVHVCWHILDTCLGEHFWCRGIHFAKCTQDMVDVPKTWSMYPRHNNVPKTWLTFFIVPKTSTQDMVNAPKTCTQDMVISWVHLIDVLGNTMSWGTSTMSWVHLRLPMVCDIEKTMQKPRGVWVKTKRQTSTSSLS